MNPDVLWYTRCPVPTAASVAIRQGWLAEEFAAEGIEVRSLASAKDRAVHLSHYNHSQPDSFRFGGYVPPLVSASRGTDVRVLGLSWPDRRAAILSLGGRGWNGAADLRGKRFSLPRRTNDSIDWWRALVLAGYRSALDAGGFTEHDVTFVEVDIGRRYVEDAVTGQRAGLSLWGARSQFAVQREEILALVRGEVDVIYSDAAMGEIVKSALGLDVVLDLTAPEETADVAKAQPLVLTATGALVDSRPDLVTRWITRLLDADGWARAHEDEVLRIAAQDSGLPEDFVHNAYSTRIHEQLNVSLTPLRLRLLQAKCDELERGGFLATPLDLSQLVEPKPLAAALELYARK
jgi:ABC-type nitrate/sulfonate/bicarbonate transport system substrate-binding protein